MCSVESFSSEWIRSININKQCIEDNISYLLKRCIIVDNNVKAALLLKAISFIDLTTLAGDDTNSNVTRLCIKADNPVPKLKNTLIFPVHTAAICVYPTKVHCAANILKKIGNENIGIAAVATGFPTGLYPLKTRLEEIQFCREQGATEIDIVIDRSLVLSGKWTELYNEIFEMKKACGDAHLKVIIGVGELGTYDNIYKASMVAMHAGADFIKTSTGKEAVNATLPIGLIMCRAIRDFYEITNRKVGLKPAGGLKTPQDAINWLILVKEVLGVEWLDKRLFRIGASSLLDGIETVLNEYIIN